MKTRRKPAASAESASFSSCGFGFESTLEPKRFKFSMSGEGSSSNSKLSQAANERGSIDLTWCTPASILEKLKLIYARVSEKETEEVDSSKLTGSSEEEGSSSEQETKEVGSMVCLAATRGPQTVNKTSSIAEAPELDVLVWSRLGDDLLQNVIVRLPLHSLFRASSLSKQWWHNFYSASFQHEVSCCSKASGGDSFCPVFVTDNRRELVGFQSSSRRWWRLPTLSYLPVEFKRWSPRWSLIAACGPLLCWTALWKDSPVLVTNPLTRRWRRLPPSPEPSNHVRVQLHIICEGGYKAYKVIVCSTGNLYKPDHQHTCIFDSTDGSWTTTEFSTTEFSTVNPEFSYSPSCSAVINGVLHRLFAIAYPGPDERFSDECYGRNPYRRIYRKCFGRNSFDLKEKVSKEVSCIYQIFPKKQNKPPRPLMLEDPGMCELFVCGSKVLLVGTQYQILSDRDSDKETISVFEVDLDDGWAFEVSRAPVELLNRIPHVRQATCHGDCIYIGDEFPSMLYNVATREWLWCHLGKTDNHDGRWRSPTTSERRPKYKELACWEWVPITYQPGLNPLMEV